MSKRGQSDRLRFVRRVTRQHGSAFATRLCSDLREGEALYEAFIAAAVIGWPAAPEDVTPAKDRYVVLQTEILERTLDLAAPAIAAAFHQAAREVIERERNG